jgi:hypothetical protein
MTMIQTDMQRKAMFARMSENNFARQLTREVERIPYIESGRDIDSGEEFYLRPMRYFYPEKAQMQEYDQRMIDTYGRDIGLAGRTPIYVLTRREPVMTKEGLPGYGSRHWDNLAIELLEQYRIDPTKITPLMFQAVADGIRDMYIKEFKEKLSEFEDQIGEVPSFIRTGGEPEKIEEKFKIEPYPEDIDDVLADLGLREKLEPLGKAKIRYGKAEPSIAFPPEMSWDDIRKAYSKFYGEDEE